MDYVGEFVQSANWKLDINARMISAILETMPSEQVSAINAKISTEIDARSIITTQNSELELICTIASIAFMLAGIFVFIFGTSLRSSKVFEWIGVLMVTIGVIMIYALLLIEVLNRAGILF